jgi:hypothetical protein
MGRLGRPTPPNKRDHKTAAQRSERRRSEIPEGRVTAGREVLEILQDAGVQPKAADDLNVPRLAPQPAIAIAADPA